jgi:hypothetical protein
MIKVSPDEAVTRVLTILAETDDETFDGVVDTLAQEGIREAAVKAAIWQLYDEGRIEMSKDWKLEVRHVAAD